MEQRLRLVQGGGGGARLEKRCSERVRVQLPGQIVWKDARGRTQLAPVVTRDLSTTGARVECRTNVSIPMYRLVYFQIDRHVRNHPDVPPALRRQNVLSAVFRVGDSNQVTGTPTEYGLRLLIEPPAVTAVAQAAASRTA